jgi:membrane fusion protein
MPSPADQPFLDPTPPPWAARALATILLSMFAVGVALLILIQVPETVSARFVLEPTRAADPVRTLHDGVVNVVDVEDGQRVEQGAVMFVVRSEPLGDRVAERQAIDARLLGRSSRAENERQKYESRRRADEQEHRRLEERLANLKRQITLKEQQLKLSREVAARLRTGVDSGVSSWIDASRPQLDADRLAAELEEVHSDIADASNMLARLVHQMDAERSAFAEIQRGIDEEATGLRARKRVLDDDTGQQEGGALQVEAPCAGTVVALFVRNAGAVIHEGDLLAEIVCADETLHAELLLPERGLALVRVGQAVKLLYDAFPYQRYGVHFATLRWVSPASTVVSGTVMFRAFADLDAETIGVEGQPRPVLPGMTGRAAVVVGRRSLASYAIEPLRQLRESLAAERRP